MERHPQVFDRFYYCNTGKFSPCRHQVSHYLRLLSIYFQAPILLYPFELVQYLLQLTIRLHLKQEIVIVRGEVSPQDLSLNPLGAH